MKPYYNIELEKGFWIYTEKLFFGIRTLSYDELIEIRQYEEMK